MNESPPSVQSQYAHGDWKNAIQKLALRIGMEGYKRMHSVTAYTEPDFQGTSQTFTPGVGTPEECKTYTNDTPQLNKEVMGVSYLGVEDRDNPV